jgi:UDP-N-acetyl-D-glucosamine dehydrogenase
MAYKKNIDDVRESPSFRLLELFNRSGALVDFHDPHVSGVSIPGHAQYYKESVPLESGTLRDYDAVVIATDHTAVDYRLVGEEATLIIDTRNVMHQFLPVRAKVAKA